MFYIHSIRIVYSLVCLDIKNQKFSDQGFMKFCENLREEVSLIITRHSRGEKTSDWHIDDYEQSNSRKRNRRFTFTQCLCFFYFRFSLAFKDLGTIDGNETFITGSSIHDGFNIDIGVYGTSNLTITDNVVHFTVGPCIDLQGQNNKLVHNLASRSVAESTYKVTFRV